MVFTTLLNIYCSRIEPYISYGLVAWGQLALNTDLTKLLLCKSGFSV